MKQYLLLTFVFLFTINSFSQCNFQAPFYEDFESASFSTLDCWEQGASNSENWYFPNSQNYLGNNGDVNNTFTISNNRYAYVDDYYNSSDSTLLTPFVDISSLSNPELSFYYINDRETDSNNVFFEIDVWDGVSWNSIHTSESNTNGWMYVKFNLSTLTITDDIRVRFRVYDIYNTTLDDLAIDDVYIGEAKTCSNVITIEASSVTVDAATISWVNIESTSTNWEVEYGEEGFVQGTGIVQTLSQSFINLSGLSSGTLYDVYIRTDCGVDSDADWIGPLQFSTNFRAPYNQDFENNMLGWDSVSWATTTLLSSNFDTVTYSNNTYIRASSNSYSVVTSPYVDIGSLVNPELSFYLMNSNDYQTNAVINVLVWDGSQWNTVYTNNIDTNGWIPVYYDLSNLTITGNIKVKFEVDDVDVTDYFKIDDLHIDEETTCFPINIISIDDITEDSAIINWGDNFNSTSDYQVTIYDDVSNLIINETVNGNSMSLTNLAPLREYTVFISAICNVTDSSLIFRKSFFTTKPLSIVDVPYDVNVIPYQLYSQDFTNLGIYNDDMYSERINLGFKFNYFGYDYHKVILGTNSVISFDPNDANSFCPFSFQYSIPSADIIDNAVLGASQDFNYNPNDVIFYAYMGTAPFRKFVFFFDDASLYYCTDLISANQTILYETYNYIDVQIKDRNVCEAYAYNNAIVGIQSIGGQYAYYPPNRNTGDWEAYNEAWRFKPVNIVPDFQYILCDTDADNIEVFNLNTIYTHFGDGTSNTYAAFETLEDAEGNVNAISTTDYSNTTNAQTIFVRELTASGDVNIKQVLLAVIDCAADYDLDTVATIDEDLNNNGNYGDDDTDGDQIPDFLDEDDDGDFVLTIVEAVVIANRDTSNYLDTDGDQISNYLDNDDDGDGILSLDEDINGNYNLLDDDTDGDGIPDYLDNELLSVANQQLDFFSVFPNPTKENLTISLNESQSNTIVKIFTVHGQEVYAKNNIDTKLVIDVSNLSNGIYFINVVVNNQTYTKKFVKE